MALDDPSFYLTLTPEPINPESPNIIRGLGFRVVSGLGLRVDVLLEQMAEGP